MDSVLDSSYHQLVIFLCVKGYCVQDYFPPLMEVSLLLCWNMLSSAK